MRLFEFLISDIENFLSSNLYYSKLVVSLQKIGIILNKKQLKQYRYVSEIL